MSCEPRAVSSRRTGPEIERTRPARGKRAPAAAFDCSSANRMPIGWARGLAVAARSARPCKSLSSVPSTETRPSGHGGGGRELGIRKRHHDGTHPDPPPSPRPVVIAEENGPSPGPDRARPWPGARPGRLAFSGSLSSSRRSIRARSAGRRRPSGRCRPGALPPSRPRSRAPGSARPRASTDRSGSGPRQPPAPSQTSRARPAARAMAMVAPRHLEGTGRRGPRSCTPAGPPRR